MGTLDDYELGVRCFDDLTFGQKISMPEHVRMQFADARFITELLHFLIDTTVDHPFAFAGPFPVARREGGKFPSGR